MKIPLPNIVLIGPYKYKVVQRADDWYHDSEAYGNAHVDKKVINVVNIGDAASQLDTFLHECMHAHWSFFHMEKKIKEEEAVTKMSTAFLTLLQQNPNILELISEVMKGNYDDKD